MIDIIIGLIMCIFIPGYAFIAALFPKSGELDVVERFGLSIGMSIVLVIITGFILGANTRVADFWLLITGAKV